MAAKSETTQRKNRQAHDTIAGSSGDSALMDQSETDQIVEEVTGTNENGDPAAFTLELTEAEKHRPVCSPASSTSRSQESTGDMMETDPLVDAEFANITSLQDEREFWGVITRAIGPLVLSTVKKTGSSILKTGMKKLSPTLSNLLRMEGFSESAIQQLESGQQISGVDESAGEQLEIFPSLANYLVPVLKPYVKKLPGKIVKTGTSWVKKMFESSEQESGVEMESLAMQLESMFMQQVASGQQESGDYESAGEQREFWKTIARKLVPVFAPIAKAAATATVDAGTSLVTGGVKKLSSKLANMLRVEGFSESAIHQLESGQKPGANGSADSQREFWGSIVKVVAPVLMPHAKKLAGKAAKAGGSWVKKMFESSEQESGAETESLAMQLETLFIQQAASGEDESGDYESAGEQREFWKTLAKKLVPVFAPVAKAAAGAAIKHGSSIISGGIKKLSPTLSNLLRMEGFSESAIQQLESGDQESGADEREFWPAIASVLVPVIRPHAKKLAGKAVKSGTSWVKKMFESSEQESGVEMESLAMQLESMFMQQVASGQQESGDYESAGEQREFWKTIARKLIPVFAPIAKAAATATVDAGTSLVTSGVKKLSSKLANMLRVEGFSESAIQQLESGQKPGANGSAASQREFWGSIVSVIAPVLMPHAKKLAGKAAKAGGSWVKKMFESSEQESGVETDSLAIQLENVFLQQAASGEQEYGDYESAGEQREFWKTLAKKLVPVFAPVAKAAAGAAVKHGTSMIKKIFESSEQESGMDTEGLALELENLFIREAAAGGQQEYSESGSNGDQREFWRAVVKKLVPVLSPIAKAAGGAALNAGSTLLKKGWNKLNPTLANMLRMEGISETAIQQLESGNEAGSVGSTVDQREFWPSIVRKIVPVLKPFAKKFGSAAINAGGSLVIGGVKRLFESVENESDGMAAHETFVQELEALEVIINQDDRVEVTNTTDIPFRRMCHLSIKAADGSAFLGTGFFIGPRTIITAGHCVYDRDHGGWPQQIIVSPGRRGANRPYGQFIATSFCSVQGWTQNQDRECDYGVIHLAKTDNVSPQIGSFGFGIFSDQALRSKRLSVAGYPGDKPSGTMWFHSRKATGINPTTIVYDIDTVGGQSGSSVYDEERRVVGIHTNGALSGNSATRITRSVFNNLSRWRAQGGAS